MKERNGGSRANGRRARPAAARAGARLPGPPRDQDETGFTAILRGLVQRVPGAKAAALVDVEGETVDYAGAIDPFVLRVAAAHGRILLDQANAASPHHAIERIAIRATRRSFTVQALPEGCALLVLMVAPSGLSRCGRAIAASVFALAEEAGWSSAVSRKRGAWYAVEVTADARRRPTALRLGQVTHAVEVVGVVVPRTAEARRERAWRVRVADGAEALLVRESGGAWYCDEPLEKLARWAR